MPYTSKLASQIVNETIVFYDVKVLAKTRIIYFRNKKEQIRLLQICPLNFQSFYPGN